jgi:hypothetical protein
MKFYIIRPSEKCVTLQNALSAKRNLNLQRETLRMLQKRTIMVKNLNRNMLRIMQLIGLYAQQLVAKLNSAEVAKLLHTT